MRASNKDTINQANFCGLLMERLERDVKQNVADTKSEYSVPNVTRLQADIVRLRRELNDLSKMLEWRYR